MLPLGQVVLVTDGARDTHTMTYAAAQNSLNRGPLGAVLRNAQGSSLGRGSTSGRASSILDRRDFYEQKPDADMSDDRHWLILTLVLAMNNSITITISVPGTIILAVFLYHRFKRLH